jgi:hypothetical protein
MEVMMPIHDWTRVGAGTFHAFHTRWITHLSDALNKGILPPGYYSDPEQHMGRKFADVLTLHASDPEELTTVPSPSEGTALAVAEAPPQVCRTFALAPSLTMLRRTLTIRHSSGHRIIALVEILSPGNKASADDIKQFVRKAKEAIGSGIHLSVIDLLPPREFDPEGIHGEIVKAFSGEKYELPEGKPLTFVSYSAGATSIAYLQHPVVGAPMPELPLFLTVERYIKLPLETTYATAWSGVPVFWREVIEGAREYPAED